MANEALGYVKDKNSGEIFAYIDKEENGFKIKPQYEPCFWGSTKNYEEISELDIQPDNNYISNVHNLIDSQQQKGLKKYGTLVNKDDYSMLGWIDHAQQEAVDFLIYLEMIKAKVKDVIG